MKLDESGKDDRIKDYVDEKVPRKNQSRWNPKDFLQLRYLLVSRCEEDMDVKQ